VGCWTITIGRQLEALRWVCGHYAFSETDFTEDLKKFDVPTLVVHGDDDQIVPIGAAARPSTTLIKNATPKVYAGAPHSIADTHKDQLCADSAGASQGLKLPHRRLAVRAGAGARNEGSFTVQSRTKEGYLRRAMGFEATYSCILVALGRPLQ
jgi:hypothetical protein